MDTRNFKKIAPFSNDFYWNLAAHSGPANHSTSFIRPVIASGDVAKTIYGNSDCYQLHSGSTDTRNFKKNCAFFRRIPDYWNLAAHSGPPNHSTSFIRPVIAVRDVAETIHGNSDCYQLHSGSTDTRNFKRNCTFFRRILDYWNLAAHSGPANYFTPFMRPVIPSRDIAEAIYGVSDSLQLRSGNMDTRNFKKLRLFLTNFTGIWRPTADPQTFPRPL